MNKPTVRRVAAAKDAPWMPAALRAERKFAQVAESCLRGIDRLSEDAPHPLEGHSLAILAGHALECALKAFLVSHGMSATAVKDTGHDLKQLWTDACDRGLKVDLPTPTYIVDLNAIHGAFNARYLEQLDAMSFGPDHAGASTIRAILSQVKDYALISEYSEGFLNSADNMARKSPAR